MTPLQETDERPAEHRAQRLMNGMHRIVSHDLPNQIVVLQGLLEMLHLEESERLSTEGQEYVERLSNVARKAASLVRVLKEMDRIRSHRSHREAVALASLVRELQVELSARFPERRIVFQEAWNDPIVQADTRPLHQAVLELLHLLIEKSPSTECRIRASSRPAATGVEVRFHLDGAAARRAAGGVRVADAPELLLAREWLAVGGAGLVLTDDGFTIHLPATLAHG